MKTLRLLPFLLLALAACQSKPKQETETKSAVAKDDSAAALAKKPGPDDPRSAADRLIRALYFEHNKTDNPFREKNRELIDQYFAKPLADQIWPKADALKAGKVNPLFNAPDKAITKTWVNPAAVGGTRAIVYVTFQDSGKDQEIKIDMQQFAGRWRITEMTYPDGKTLTQAVQ